MLDGIRLWLCRWLRVPPEPAAPFGSPESIRVFRAGAMYYRYRIALWVLIQFGVALGIAGGAFAFERPMRRAPKWAYTGWKVLEVMAAAGFVAQLPVGLLARRLDYTMRWYIVTDRSLRIRSGIWDVQEATMTFANVQHIGVTQGPLQRLLGLADVTVSSAGGGSAAAAHEGHVHSGHLARFEGVANAHEIRELIVERLRQYRDAGLGDPDDAHSASAAPSELEAARALLEAARELRASLEASR
jgi:membrane protein YdbS with pleckstrin-like domain